ncbi:hypothetical protein Tco_1178442 [Tanacetum coccineum]
MVISDEEPDLEDASKHVRNETGDDENLDINAGFSDDVIDTGADLGLNDDKVSLGIDNADMEVSAGGEIPSAVEEQVNTASADITDIGVSTAAPESVNAADESQIEKEVAEVVTIAKIIVIVSKDAAAEVISTAGNSLSCATRMLINIPRRPPRDITFTACVSDMISTWLIICQLKLFRNFNSKFEEPDLEAAEAFFSQPSSKFG